MARSGTIAIAAVLLVALLAAGTNACRNEDGIGLMGYDIKVVQLPAGSTNNDCCRACNGLSGECKSFTFAKSTRTCYMKSLEMGSQPYVSARFTWADMVSAEPGCCRNGNVVASVQG